MSKINAILSTTKSRAEKAPKNRKKGKIPLKIHAKMAEPTPAKTPEKQADKAPDTGSNLPNAVSPNTPITSPNNPTASSNNTANPNTSLESNPKQGSYTADNIQVLGGLDAVRKRPAMYICSTDVRGLHHLVYEVLDNSVDEALAGFCTQIDVIINEDGSVTVKDNGRGIPVDNHPKFNRPALEIVLTKLHAGGKFDKSSYKVSGGLHGVGVSCVNGLSSKLIVEVKRDLKIYSMEFQKGITVGDMKIIGESKETGTIVTFWPDPEIFPITEFSFDILSSRLRELAFLNKGLKITITD